MHVTLEYILAGMLMILVLMGTEITMNSLMNQRLTALQEGNQINAADRLLNTILLSSGDPANWGTDVNQQPVSLGLADQNALAPYSLDLNKVMRLEDGSAGYISPTSARDMLGLRSDIQFSLAISPAMTVNIQGNGPFTITVRDNRGTLDPNVNVTAYYVPSGFTGSRSIPVTNKTGLDGACTVRFAAKAGYVLVVQAAQSGITMITSTTGWTYLIEGGIVEATDIPVFTGLTFMTGYVSGTSKDSAQRYAEIGGQTYVVKLDLWGD